MHMQAFQAVAEFLRGQSLPRNVVEIGSKNVNGSVRPLFPGASYVGVDVVEGPCVDVVADGAVFKPAVPPDCIVCCEVLEHAENAQEMVANAVDILQPGGQVIITCASDGRAPHSAVDGGPLRAGEFYRNVPPNLLQQWLELAGAKDIQIAYAADCGDVYAMGFKA
jgi:hypothetical protein